MSWHGYAGDGGGPLPANESLNIQGMAGGQELYRSQARAAKFEEQCRKAQATQAAVDARAAETEARERAAAKAQQALDWDSEVCRKAGVLPGDIEARKRAQEACGGVRSPAVPPDQPGNSVTGNCNFDAQGAAIVAADRAEASALLRVAKLPDGRGRR